MDTYINTFHIENWDKSYWKKTNHVLLEYRNKERSWLRGLDRQQVGNIFQTEVKEGKMELEQMMSVRQGQSNYKEAFAMGWVEEECGSKQSLSDTIRQRLSTIHSTNTPSAFNYTRSPWFRLASLMWYLKKKKPLVQLIGSICQIL